MTLEIPANKLYQQSQSLAFDSNNIFCLIGENGSGKSSILEEVFKKYIEDDDKRIICFTSGQNELFNSIFNEHKRKNKRYMKEEDRTISSFYFNNIWVRILIFFATALKNNGKVRSYLENKGYIDVRGRQDDLTTKLKFRFRVTSDYSLRIKREIENEAKPEFDTETKLIRKTIFHKLLIKLIDALYEEAPEIENGEAIKLQKFEISAKKILTIFGRNIDDIFTFLAHAAHGYRPNITLNECRLYFKNEMEFEQLSDGEYQLLSIYALIDLFDSPETLFLFDEIDSHLHFGNINKLWDTLKSIQGKLISTTHISESILKNSFDNLLYVDGGKIEKDLTAREVFKRLSNVTGQKKYEYKVAARIEHIALLDDEVDWFIFKKLAVKKIGSEAIEILKKITPYKRSSSFATTNEIFGKAKLIFAKEFKEVNEGSQTQTKNIFCICDRDSLPLTQIGENLEVNIHSDYNSIKSFGATKTHLTSWKRLEIENYLLSKTMLEAKDKMQEVRDLFHSVSFNTTTVFDDSEDLRIYDCKELLKPLYKDAGFDEAKLDELIELIPVNEISEDIVKMYNFIKSKVEPNA